MPLLKGWVENTNPLLKLYIYASDFGVLNHLKRRTINANFTICTIILNKKQRQGGSPVMEFG